MLPNILFKTKLNTCLIEIVPVRHCVQISPVPEGGV